MKKRKRFIRLVTVLCAAIFVFGSQMTVFAATSIVGGQGTKTGTATASASTSSTSSTSSAAQSAVQKANTSSNTNNGTTAAATGSTASTTQTASRVTTAVQTGVMEHIYPFLLGIAAAFAVFAFFFHLQMNQVRYGKSEKYYKELLDFICACKL